MELSATASRIAGTCRELMEGVGLSPFAFILDPVFDPTYNERASGTEECGENPQRSRHCNRVCVRQILPRREGWPLRSARPREGVGTTEDPEARILPRGVPGAWSLRLNSVVRGIVVASPSRTVSNVSVIRRAGRMRPGFRAIGGIDVGTATVLRAAKTGGRLWRADPAEAMSLSFGE